MASGLTHIEDRFDGHSILATVGRRGSMSRASHPAGGKVFCSGSMEACLLPELPRGLVGSSLSDMEQRGCTAHGSRVAMLSMTWSSETTLARHLSDIVIVWRYIRQWSIWYISESE